MNTLRSIVAVTVCLSLSVTLTAAAAADTAAPVPEEKHWVYSELKEFKQLIVPRKDEALAAGPVTKEEWAAFQADVLDGSKLDVPIAPAHWATMLKLSVRLPKEQTGKLLDTYVYGLLASPYAQDIAREDAVGGLVKLLTVETISGEWRSGSGRDASKELTDYRNISDKQSGLVCIAYRDGILDGSVTSSKAFHPKAKLTHAEAISMMDRVMKTYDGVSRGGSWPTLHWSAAEMTGFLNSYGATGNVALKALLQRNVPATAAGLNEPVPVKLWHELLLAALNLKFNKGSSGYNSFYEDYTIKLAHGESIARDRAIAGAMKIGGPLRDASKEERDAAQKAFSDFGDAADGSKLALAYREGLIGGFEDGTFRPHNDLTYGEAFILAARLSVRGAKP